MPFVAPSTVTSVVVTGADRAGYLDAVLSQRVDGLEEGQVAGALCLDQHGAPLAVMSVSVLADRILLLLPDRELASEVAETLGGRTFLKDARFAVTDHVTWSLRGADGRQVAGDAGFAAEPGTVTDDGDLVVVGREDGIDLVGPADAVDAAVEACVAAGARRADGERLEAWRVERGEPAWQREIRPPHLPEEAGLLPTHVHLAKGCYPGQEAVARMWNLGRPRRRLARVDLSGDAGTGWTTGEGRARVEVTSAAAGDDPRPALAYVPPDAQPGDRYGDAGGVLVVREFVGEGRPIPGHDPSVVRRRDRRAAD